MPDVTEQEQINKPTESEYTKLGHEVYENEPDIIKKYLYVLRRPKPAFNHYQFIWPIRQAFCIINKTSVGDLRGTGKSRDVIELRRDFIAVVTHLYNPELLTGYSDVMSSGLAEELRKSLGVDRTWISQEVAQIKRLFKPAKFNQPIILERQAKILLIAERLMEEVGEEDEQPKAEVVDLFKEQAS